jgi:hypothetical protein
MLAPMRRNHLIAAAGICLALIIYATLARLAGRPVLVVHAEAYWVVVIERFSAYGLLASCCRSCCRGASNWLARSWWPLPSASRSCRR